MSQGRLWELHVRGKYCWWIGKWWTVTRVWGNAARHARGACRGLFGLPRTTGFERDYATLGSGFWVCHDDHAHPDGKSWTHGPMRFETFGEWALDLAAHWGLVFRLAALGFLDTPTGADGETLFWRWDPWNAKCRANLIRLRDEHRLRKHQAAGAL